MKIILLSSMLIVLVSACVPQREAQKAPMYGTIVTGDPVFFSGSRTYAWDPVMVQAFLYSEELETQALGWYLSAIESELNQKGYRLVSLPNADFFVGVGIAQESQLSDEFIYDKTKLSTGVNNFNTEGTVVEKGSIFITFSLPSSSRPAWKILTQLGLSHQSTQTQRTDLAKERIAMMLRAVPKVQ